MRTKLRLVGDVHGKYSGYLQAVEKCDFTIQLGDLGFDYSVLNGLDPSFNKVLGGNHDNYECVHGKFVNQTPHFLGDYGIVSVPDVGELFFLRGGNSIDKDMRVEGKSWWAQEEISYGVGLEALEFYRQAKPKIVISHECPESIIPLVSTLASWNGLPIRPSMTAVLLQRMLEIHRPDFWFFGHHHRKFSAHVGSTSFTCLPELGVYDFIEI